MSHLGDLIVEGGPYESRLDHIRGTYGPPYAWAKADDLNALRDELIELREARSELAVLRETSQAGWSDFDGDRRYRYPDGTADPEA